MNGVRFWKTPRKGHQQTKIACRYHERNSGQGRGEQPGVLPGKARKPSHVTLTARKRGRSRVVVLICRRGRADQLYHLQGGAATVIIKKEEGCFPKEKSLAISGKKKSLVEGEKKKETLVRPEERRRTKFKWEPAPASLLPKEGNDMKLKR